MSTPRYVLDLIEQWDNLISEFNAIIDTPSSHFQVYFGHSDGPKDALTETDITQQEMQEFYRIRLRKVATELQAHNIEVKVP